MICAHPGCKTITIRERCAKHSGRIGSHCTSFRAGRFNATRMDARPQKLLTSDIPNPGEFSAGALVQLALIVPAGGHEAGGPRAIALGPSS